MIICSKCNIPIQNINVSRYSEGYDIKVECHGEKDEMQLTDKFLEENSDIGLAYHINNGTVQGFAFKE
jgi:hypothetical protein